MDASTLKKHILKSFIVLGGLICLFVLGTLAGYEPIIGLVIVAGIGFVVLFYSRPEWFAYLCVLVMCFAGLLHLRITDGGFSSVVAIASSGLALHIFGSLLTKDRQLLKVFGHRFDQLLPIVMLIAMMVSVKNSLWVPETLPVGFRKICPVEDVIAPSR